jgi:hypothetical protein
MHSGKSLASPQQFVLIGDLALILISVLGSFAWLDASNLPDYFRAVALMCGALR